MISYRCILNFNWTTTIFIWNLALADFLYCFVNVPIFAMHYFRQKWDWGRFSCKLTANLRYTIAIAAWMSVAMVAVVRCSSVIYPIKSAKFFTSKNRIILVSMIWTYALVLLLPSNLKVRCMLKVNFRTNRFSIFLHTFS